ncbi:hypothetical protein HHI36_014858 [Cryptolaemus montrouzieri]|uniref:Uncharacterized protein n=1 Tax=Cryptolaemus montrouzieri TaxID=559131 RepID=A0ABD2N4C8_9CUCU
MSINNIQSTNEQIESANPEDELNSVNLQNVLQPIEMDRRSSNINLAACGSHNSQSTPKRPPSPSPPNSPDINTQNSEYRIKKPIQNKHKR